jgi:hypothetical protein
VVGAGDRLLRELVEADGEPLSAAAAVDEDDRRPVLLDEPEQLWVDGRPDRALRHRFAKPGPDEVAAARGRPLTADRRVRHVVRARLAHVVDRDVDLQVERLAHAGVDDLALAPGADQEAADLLQRTLGCRQPDALERPPGDVLEPLERQRQVRAALGLGDRVDLVDDHRVGLG